MIDPELYAYRLYTQNRERDGAMPVRGVLVLGLILLLAWSLVLSGCATTTPGPTPPPTPPVSELMQTLFPAALQAAVTVQTQVLLAWHPDLVPYLVQWLDAVCTFTTGPVTNTQLQDLLVGALASIPNMPDWSRHVLADFIPIVVGLIPIALQVAEVAVPEVASAMVIASDVCKWIQQAIPPKLLPVKGT